MKFRRSNSFVTLIDKTHYVKKKKTIFERIFLFQKQYYSHQRDWWLQMNNVFFLFYFKHKYLLAQYKISTFRQTRIDGKLMVYIVYMKETFL